MDPQVNSCLILSGVGILFVSLGSVFFWQSRAKTSWKWIWWGLGLWSLAVAVKALFGIFITPKLNLLLSTRFPGTLSSILFLLYIGFLTVITEVWLTYQIIKSRLAKATFNEAVTFGLGYGAGEAATLGLYSLVAFLVVTVAPQILPAELLKEAAYPCVVVIAPIFERSMAIAVHLLASLWLYEAASQNKTLSLLWAVAVKGGMDASALTLAALVAQGTGGIFLAEIPIGFVGGGAIFLLVRRFRPQVVVPSWLPGLFFAAAFGFIVYFSRMVSPSSAANAGVPSFSGENLACASPVKVSGQALAPKIPEGKTLIMDKCVKDRENLPPETVVLFQGEKNLALGIIIEKGEDESGVNYLIWRRFNPETKITIKAAQIIGVWQPK